MRALGEGDVADPFGLVGLDLRVQLLPHLHAKTIEE